MEAPVDCDRATIPAMASCETDPVIAIMEERKRAVAGTRNFRVIRPPADGKSLLGGTLPKNRACDYILSVYPVTPSFLSDYYRPGIE
jgi:hypothetical protein